MIDTVLFDLDGTLLPIDIKVFVTSYLGAIGRFARGRGINGFAFVTAVREGLDAMFDNDGTQSNENAFWAAFGDRFSRTHSQDEVRELCMDFYRTDFNRIADKVEPDPFAACAIDLLKARGYRIALATNPLFPHIATWERCGWTGVDPAKFELITTYEDYSFAKPKIGYYREVLDNLGVEASRCLMVGNDVDEDMCASELGIATYLITPYLLNRSESDLDVYEKGTLEDLCTYIEKLPDLTI